MSRLDLGSIDKVVLGIGVSVGETCSRSKYICGIHGRVVDWDRGKRNRPRSRGRIYIWM